jgi:hypothetical protein
MSDFLQRLAERTFGSAAIVQPLISSRFTSQLATPGQSPMSGAAHPLPVASPPTAAPGPLPPARPSHRIEPHPIEPHRIEPHRIEPHRIEPPDDASTVRDELLLPQPIPNPSAIGEGPAETASPHDRRAATVPHPAAEVALASQIIRSVAQPLAASGNRIAEGIRATPVLTIPEANTSAQALFRPQEAPGREEARLTKDARSIAADPGRARLEQAERQQRAEPLVSTVPLELDAKRPEIGVQQASAEPKVIQVTIGRIEIRASVSAPPVRKTPPQARAIGLDEYLSHRQGRPR